MIFEAPLWLFGLFALPLVTALELWLTGRDRDRTARWLARPLWARVLRRPAERWRFIRLACLLLGTAGVVLALARPQWGIVREKVEREGVDIVVLLDTSGSMATEDVAPNRFFIARQAVGSLVARLEGDRFALVAFEGEAYPLVPLTLDADAIGLFLDTIEPGIVPSPGSSIGAGLAKGLDLFVDQSRHHKVMVLISDGEDLEGEVAEAVRRAKEAGVVVHAVAVGTENGQPVPDFDTDGRQIGFKRDADGTPVVSRVNLSTLEEIARGTGGQVFRITPNDPTLSSLASAIEGMEQKSLFREYSYRRKERFQIPLAVGLLAIAIGLLVPPPPLRRTGSIVAALLLAFGFATRADAQTPNASPPSPDPTATSPSPGDPAAGVAAPQPQVKKPLTPAARMKDELLLRPRRLTSKGKKLYSEGNHPQALEDFERAAKSRPEDARSRFNVADGLYKNGKFDEAATLFQSLGQERASGLAGPSLYNRGNTLYQKQDYRGAIDSYRDALRRAPSDLDTRRNLEMALRALEAQKEQQKKQQNSKDQQDQKKDEKSQDQQKQEQQQQKQQQQQQQQQTPEQRENQRFKDEAGMPKDRAMQLLDALQRNEKDEQKKLIQAQRAKRRGGKDW